MTVVRWVMVAVVISAGLAEMAAQAPAPIPTSQGKVVRLDRALGSIIKTDAVIEKVAGGLGFVEGPVWTREYALLFSDLPANAVMKLSAGKQPTLFLKPSGYTGSEPRREGSYVGSNGLTIDREGRLILAEHGDRRVTRIRRDGTREVIADKYLRMRFNSPNDVVQKGDGNIYFTDPPYGLPEQMADPQKELPFSGVYRAAYGRVQLMAQGLDFPNGLAFSPDEKYLYVSSSDENNRLWMRYDVRGDGILGAGKIFYDARKDPLRGVPDGMKVDARGNLFATGPGGVVIISEKAKMLGRIELPEQPSNVAWGDDGKSLYITARTSIYRVKVLTGGRRPCCN